MAHFIPTLSSNQYKFYPLGRKLRKTYQNFCGGRSLPVANCILPSGEGLGWGMFLWFLFFAPKKWTSSERRVKLASTFPSREGIRLWSNEQDWGLGVSPRELVLLSKEGMEWMMEWLMWWWLGWMVLVWCYTLHRAEALCWVMSPLQGRWWGVGNPFVGPRPYAPLYCPFRALDNPEGV